MAFFVECMQPVNLVLTAFVIACFGYWILVIAGFLGVEVMDFDLDIDGDMDVDVEVDAGAGAADLGSVGLIKGFFRFFHFHEVPVMIVMTVLCSVTWFLFTMLNLYWNQDHNMMLSLIYLLPTLLAGLALSKLALQPLAMLFRQVNIPEKQMPDYVGEECLVMTSEVNKTFGQGQISTDQSPLIIQIRNLTAYRFSKGDKAVLVRFDAAGRFFEIGPQQKKPDSNP